MKYEFASRTADVARPDPGVLEAADGNELLARIVQSRLEGIAREEGAGTQEPGDLASRARSFLHPDKEQLVDPLAFRDMPRATRLIREAAESGRPIHVYGDYDVDGVAASAIMARALAKLGARAAVSLPSRTGSGYGLTPEAVSELPDGALLITVDCGITAAEEVRLAREKGLDVILTDHHEPPEQLPDATCVLNPRVAGETYPNKHICGSGIAFKIAQALLEDEADELVELAGIATLADVMLLNEENRALVSLGIRQLNRDPSPGTRALVQRVQSKGRPVTSSDVSFSIVPVLNAAGRVASARLAFDLLMATSDGIATVLTASLLESNEKRKKVQEACLQDALSQVRKDNVPYFLVLYSDGWHPGVLGPVAAKVAEQYGRPTLILTRVDDKYVGSARTAGGIHLQNALSQFENLMVRFGGHAAAAGLTVLPENLPALRGELEVYGKKRRELLTGPRQYEYDVALPAPVSPEVCEAFERLEPFGHGAEAPVVLFQDARITSVRGMKEGAHASFDISTGGASMRGVAFGTSPDAIPQRADVAGTVQVSSFSGRPEMIVRAISEKGPVGEEDFFARALDDIRHRSRTLPAEAYYRDKPRLGLVYTALRATAPPEGGISRNDLYVAMRAKVPDLRREETAFAWAVFSELNLIAGLLDDNIRIVPSRTKQNLDDSRVYATFRKYALAASGGAPGPGRQAPGAGPHGRQALRREEVGGPKAAGPARVQRMDLKEKIRNINDFPEKGIVFRDITTLIGDGEAYHEVIDEFIERVRPLDPDVILVLDARGFLVGTPVAYELRKGVVPIRKPGKLPAETYHVEYELEYGTDAFEMHKDAIEPGQRVAILDDLLATGGTARAACDLVKMAGGEVVAVGFVIELTGLNGRDKLEGYNVFSLVQY